MDGLVLLFTLSFSIQCFTKGLLLPYGLGGLFGGRSGTPSTSNSTFGIPGKRVGTFPELSTQQTLSPIQPNLLGQSDFVLR